MNYGFKDQSICNLIACLDGKRMKGTSPSRCCGEVSANGNKCHDGISDISSTPRKGKSMSIITVGIDLAKNVFAVHGVNDSGKPALVKPKVQRAGLLPLIAQLPPCLIGMEACSGSVSIPPSRRLDADCLPLVHHQGRRWLPAQPAGYGSASGAQ